MGGIVLGTDDAEESSNINNISKPPKRLRDGVVLDCSTIQTFQSFELDVINTTMDSSPLKKVKHGFCHPNHAEIKGPHNTSYTLIEYQTKKKNRFESAILQLKEGDNRAVIEYL